MFSARAKAAYKQENPEHAAEIMRTNRGCVPVVIHYGDVTLRLCVIRDMTVGTLLNKVRAQLVGKADTAEKKREAATMALFMMVRGTTLACISDEIGKVYEDRKDADEHLHIVLLREATFG